MIYGGAAYLYHIPRDVNKLVGEVLIGRVDPGDAVSANIGFRFRAQPACFSFSLGCRHRYIFPTKTEIGATEPGNPPASTSVRSISACRTALTERRHVLNMGFEIGVTEDARPTCRSRCSMPFGGKL